MRIIFVIRLQLAKIWLKKGVLEVFLSTLVWYDQSENYEEKYTMQK